MTDLQGFKDAIRVTDTLSDQIQAWEAYAQALENELAITRRQRDDIADIASRNQRKAQNAIEILGGRKG